MTGPDGDPLAPLREQRRVRLLQLEEQVESAAKAALAVWLRVARRMVLPDTAPNLVAAAAPTPELLPGTKTAWLEQVDSTLRAALEYTFAAGVDDAGGGDVELLQVAQARADYLASLTNRLSGPPDAAWRLVTAAVTELTEAGASIPKIRSAIEAILSAGEWANDAHTIARTETIGAYNAGTYAAWQAAEDALDEDTDKVWVSTHDDRTREDHRDADGQRVALDGMFMVGGHPMRFPGDPLAPASEVVNCRCTMIQVEAGEPLPQVKSHPWPARDEGGAIEVVTAAGGPLGEGTSMPRWKSLMAPLGKSSGDRRVLAADGEFSFRDLPLPLRWAREDAPGHDGAVTVGRITEASIGGQFDGSGDWLVEVPETAEAMMLTENGVLYPSVDLDDLTYTFAHPETFTPLEDLTEAELEEMWEAGLEPVLYITKARVMAVTLVGTQAFAEARIWMVADDEETGEDTADDAGEARTRYRVAVTAAGVPAKGGVVKRFKRAPLYPPREWFQEPQLTELTPVTITTDGQVFGHLSDRDCHMSLLMQGVCLLPPEEGGFDWFHAAETELEDGGLLAIGHITTGTGHARIDLNAVQAMAHYDNTGTQAAVIRGGRDEHGHWVAGAMVPEATPEQAQLIRRSPLSGDWRDVGGLRQLVAALAVNRGGFPVVRGRVSGGRMRTVIASGWHGWRPSTGRVVTPGTGSDIASIEAAMRRVLTTEGDRQRLRRQADRVAANIGRDTRSLVASLDAQVHGTAVPSQ